MPTETEKRAETETPETDPEKVIITRERFDTLQQQARDEGMAYAFGLLHGAGLLDPAIDREKRLTEVKELVFAGFSGRRMSTLINPQIRAGFDEGQRRKPVQPAELRTVKVAGGEREVVL
ncbi:MAG: hypothetical protein HC828_02055 [Blastochloris sp.]|nr:hypothetical protein [Blastochloris sp.]